MAKCDDKESMEMIVNSSENEERLPVAFVSVGIQSESLKSFEDSNVVLTKSWSEYEESDDENKVFVGKRKKKHQRELKRKVDPEIKLSLTDQTSEVPPKRVKIESDSSEHCGEESKKTSIEFHTGLDVKAGDVKVADMTTKSRSFHNVPKHVRPGYSDDRFSETSYYLESGLRKVYPYYFTFTTFTKGRWVGNKILDVFSREFRAHPAEVYKKCIEAGSLTVNYEKVSIDYELKHNDLLANTVHRHEVPVAACSIDVVHIDKDVVVINKPASIPVHPCGRYRHNTIVFILGKEYNLKNLRTVHRLDRLTSGVLMFGRSVRKALEMEQQIRNRLVSKEYICRVEGDFPYDEIECCEPIEVVSYKIGVCKVSPTGKDCSTTFKKIGYNSHTNTSVLRCLPHTGRMHQIRVHLQYLGYPVMRDPLYNHPVFGPEKGKGGRIGKTDEELIQDLITIHNAENWLGMDGDVGVGDGMLSVQSVGDQVEEDLDMCSQNEGVDDTNLKSEPVLFVSIGTQTNHEEPDSKFQRSKLSREARCSECKVKFRDPKPSDLIMYLHAYRYKGPNWMYETPLPSWADVNWSEKPME